MALPQIVRIQYNSDFTINAKLPEGYDNQDFIIRLYTTDKDNYYEASYRNGEYENCLTDSENKNITIYVNNCSYSYGYINNHSLQPGCLHICTVFDYENNHFEDGIENIIMAEETNIYLVKQNANATSAMYVGSALPDLTDSSDFITESDLEFELLNYYTKEEIDNAGYISHEDLNGYVTEEELNDMGFLSAAQLDAMGYATVSYVDSKTDTKQDMLISGVNIKTVNGYSLLGNGNLLIEGGGGAIDLSAYVTKTELSQAGYVSQSQLSQAGYLTTVPDIYATKTYVENYVSEYAPQVDLSAYVTHYELNSASYVSNTELSQASYVSQSQLSQAGYVTNQELSQAGYLTTVPDNYATKTYVADYVDTHTGGIDLSAYVTKTELSQASYATQSYVDDAIADAFEDSDFVTETDVNNLLSTASYVTSSELSAMGYITNQDLEQTLSNATYITQNELESQLADYVTSSELSNAGYVTSSALSQASYVTSSDLSNMGYITSIPTEYVTESELSAKGYITSIPAEYVTQTELSGMGYLTAVPSEYITETEIAGMGYITATELSNASYATSTDLVSYLNIANFNRTVPVQLINVGLTVITTNVPNTIAPQALTYSQFTSLTNPWVGGSTMVNYVNEVMPKIDESIIPNTTATYTLGDSSHLYSAAYITNVKFTDNGRSSISAPNSSSLRLAPDDIGFYLEKNGFRPGTSGNKLLGTSSMQWGYTYSQNFIENGTNIKDIYSQTEVVTQAQYDQLTTEQKNSETIYVISDQQAYFDNELVTETSLDSRGFLTADNFQYDPTTGTLTLVL